MGSEHPQLIAESRLTELKQARTVFIQTLGLNLIVSFSKLICGFMTNTVSMIADGFHSFMDASSNIIGIIGITISLRPPDDGHPYGHKKFEAIAAMAISFIMFLACFNVVSQVIERVVLGKGAPPSTNYVSYLVMFFSVAVNIGVTIYERRKAKALSSALLKADSEHTLSDIYVSLSVIVAVIAAQFHFYLIDITASLIIVLAIFKAGFGIISTHIGSLVDAAVLDPKLIEKLVLETPGVLSCHKIRSRGMHDHVFVDLHVQVSGTLTVEEAHKISYAVETNLKEKAAGVTDVIVHLEEPLELSNSSENVKEHTECVQSNNGE